MRLSTLHAKACLHCTLSSFGFCSGELTVLLSAVEMDRCVCWSFIQPFSPPPPNQMCFHSSPLHQSLITHPSGIVQVSPVAVATAGCEELRGNVLLLWPWSLSLFCWLFHSIVPGSYTVSQTQLTGLNLPSQLWNFKDYSSHYCSLTFFTLRRSRCSIFQMPRFRF